MPVEALTQFLDDKQIRYVTIRHSTAYTAQEVAHSAHLSGKEVAKTVIVDLDGRMTMAVLRANDRVDLDLLRRAAGARNVRLVEEREFADRFPQVEPGAMPPFGNLYDMEVFVDEAIRHDERIAFAAGSHTELIQLTYADFERLVQPAIAQFAAE